MRRVAPAPAAVAKTTAVRRAAAIRQASAITQRPGRPLHGPARERAEQSLGHDLRNVRIHTDDEAARMADAVGVRAFTIGRDIAFASGAWSPGTSGGERRFAHELVHAAQQARAHDRGEGRVATRAEEHDADAGATAVLAGQAHVPVSSPLAFAAEDGPTATEVPALDLINPYGDPTEEELEKVEDAKKAMLAALDKYDSFRFHNRLRSLSASVRLTLDGDKAFHAAIRKRLWGKSYWIFQLHLRFGSRRPGYVHQLSLAMLSKDGRTAADLLRAFPDLTNPHVVPGVYEVLAHEFKDHPWRSTLLRLAREKESARRTEAYSYKEVHYEKAKGGGWALKRYGGTAHYDLARTANELRVVVRLHLVEKKDITKTYWPSDAKQKNWRDRIEFVWNNRYAANNGTHRLRIRFVPVFTPDSPHFTVHIVRSKKYFRSNETEWWESASASTVAHEFGHMVGNPDEYRLPGKMSDVPKSMGLSKADTKRSTVEGVTGKAPAESPAKGTSLKGVMGEPHKEGTHAERRHVWPILDRYNRTLKPAGENDYVLVSD